jgi:FdhD protein
MKSSVSHTAITRITGSETLETADLLAAEEPMEIRIGYSAHGERYQKSIAVTMRTPGNDFELAIGFLFTEGLITSLSQVHTIKYCTEANTIEQNDNIVRVELKDDVTIDLSKLQRNFYTTSSCGICGKESIDMVRTACSPVTEQLPLNVSRQLVISLPDKLRDAQRVFEHTGGIHASALFDTEGTLLLLREDVGRHNALDKLIGASLAKFPGGQNPVGHILLLSGRASFELIQKAAMAGIRIVCAVGAPSSLAVALAEEFGITLIGFLRGDRFNIYSHPQTIC